MLDGDCIECLASTGMEAPLVSAKYLGLHIIRLLVVHLAKEHERTHQLRYADNVVHNPLPPGRPQLRLDK